MKVWLIQRAEPTVLDNNGAQRLMRMGLLARYCVEAGHEVVWWTSTFDHYNRVHRYDVDTQVAIDASYSIYFLRGCGYNRNISLARVLDNKLVANKFAKLSREQSSKPDVILASLPTAELALAAIKYGKEAGVPVLLDVRDLWPDVFLTYTSPSVRWLAKLILWPLERQTRSVCSRATAILGITDEFVDWGLEKGSRLRSEYDVFFPMGYLSAAESSDDIDQAAYFWAENGVEKESGQLLVVFFGTLGEGFEFGPVVEAAQLLKERDVNIRFVICGAGEQESKVAAFAADNDNITYPGWVDKVQIRALLQMADIGLAPYIERADFETSFPNKVAEYLSGPAAIALSFEEGGSEAFD